MRKYAWPDGYNFVRSLVRTYKQVKDPIGTISESAQRFNGTYAVNLGLTRMIVTQDPGFIEYVLKGNHRNYHKSKILTEQLGRFLGKGLLSSNGEYWLRQRRLIQPGFHIDRIRALYAIMNNTVNDFLSKFPTGDNIDIYPLINRLAFDIVINTLFNVDISEETRTGISSFISETQDFVIRDVRQPYKSWWFSLSGEVKRNLKKAEQTRNLIRGIIQQRKESGKKFNDLLDMLLEARYEDNGEPMEERQVIDEILILIIAGHETTANALSFALYLLAGHPEVLTRLREKTLGLQLHEYAMHKELLAVINETMRLYPPAWLSDRVSLEDDEYNGFSFPGGTIIALYYYGLHRDPQYWSDPEAFRPERFLNDDKQKLKAFYPFGSGPRLCIGNNFALSEMAIFLHAFIHRFDIFPSGRKPQLKVLVTLRPDNVFLKVSERARL